MRVWRAVPRCDPPPGLLVKQMKYWFFDTRVAHRDPPVCDFVLVPSARIQISFLVPSARIQMYEIDEID